MNVLLMDNLIETLLNLVIIGRAGRAMIGHAFSDCLLYTVYYFMTTKNSLFITFKQSSSL